MVIESSSIYDHIGGQLTIDNLVDVFYAKIEADPELRAIFPDDLEPGKHWQKLFLAQLFGGPMLYNQQRGHPRLRMRHMSFSVSPRSAELWLKHMHAAIDEIGIQEPERSAMFEYFDRAAPHMINLSPSGGNIEF